MALSLASFQIKAAFDQELELDSSALTGVLSYLATEFKAVARPIFKKEGFSAEVLETNNKYVTGTRAASRKNNGEKQEGPYLEINTVFSGFPSGPQTENGPLDMKLLEVSQKVIKAIKLASAEVFKASGIALSLKDVKVEILRQQEYCWDPLPPEEIEGTLQRSPKSPREFGLTPFSVFPIQPQDKYRL